MSAHFHFAMRWDSLLKMANKEGGGVCCQKIYNISGSATIWIKQTLESQKPCSGKLPALQNQRDSSFRFYYATEKQKNRFRLGSANTFTAATKPKQPQYWWFKSSRQWRLNKQHQWCHNGATQCTSPWQNKLPSTLIPPTSICPPGAASTAGSAREGECLSISPSLSTGWLHSFLA